MVTNEHSRPPARPAPDATSAPRHDEATLAAPPRPTIALDATRASSDVSFRPAAPDPLATLARDHASLRTDVTTAASLAFRTLGRAPPASAHHELRLPEEGERVGRFIILRELGRGAMGVVYAAYDEELARRVAIKLLHFGPNIDASSGRSQLLREAQALARLTHPNVVGVYEAGVWQRSVYVAMEYVQGVDLQAWLAAERRPWRETLAVLCQAGEGLLAAHRSGLVHRDFKPSNVLVGDDGRARVADFGLAARRGEIPVGDLQNALPSLLTSTIAGDGALVGTPAYMAPEQVRRGEATTHSDQFAFCVALYEALYGVRPFRGDDFASLASAIQHEDPPPPPASNSAPAWLLPLIRRGLAKDPAQRYPSLAELLRELARDPEAERARRRRLTLQLVTTAIFTLLTIVGGVRLYGAVVRHNAERRADLRLAELHEQLADPRVKDSPGEAERLLVAFAAYPDNRGTTAISRAHREHAAELADPAAAVDAYTSAFLTATTQTDEIAALRGLIPRLVAAGRHVEAGEALATLDRRAPELARDPELALARRTAALRRRDLPSARAALDDLPADDPMRTYGQVLEDMSHATALDPARFGHRDDENHAFSSRDLDGDARPDLAVATPDLGRGSFTIVRGTSQLPGLGTLRTGQPELFYVQLLPDFGEGPLLLSAARLPDRGNNLRFALAEPLTDGSLREHLVWEDSPRLVAVASDLDHDGRRELYLGAGAYTRRIVQPERDADGRWQLRSPLPAIDRLGSDINGLAAGDLDGDGREELVVAVGPWRAFDLRVLRRGPDGALTLVARRSTGMVNTIGLVRVGDELWIAAVKQDAYPSAARFSSQAPFGPPAGLYLFALRGGALVEVGFHPTAAVPGVVELDYPLLVADLDGDGHDDLVLRGKESSHGASNLLVYRQHVGELLPPLVMHGLAPLAALELDDDLGAELLVGDTHHHPREFFAIGLGGDPLPPLATPRDAERPLPPGLEDPALVAAWRRTEEMVAIGLPLRSAAELSALAGPSGHVREDLLLRAGELYARAGDHAAAAEHFVAAAERPDLAAEALAGAIRSRRALGEITAETALAERRAVLPDLDPQTRAAAESELDVLRRATAPRHRLALRFERPLDPRWRAHDPLRLTRDPTRDALRLQTAIDPTVASLPLRHAGGTIVVAYDLEAELAEWGTQIGLRLVDGDAVLVGTTVGGMGSTDAPNFSIDISANIQMMRPRPPPGPIRVRHEIYPELGLETVEYQLPGEAPIRQTRPFDKRLPRRPVLRLHATSQLPFFFARAFIRSIELEGLEIDDNLGPDPDQPLARTIVEGELATALAALPATDELPPGDLRLLWRGSLLARLDDPDAAAAALRRGLAVPEDSSIYTHLTALLQDGDPLWNSAVRRALGPHSVRYHYPVGLLSHPWRPGAVATALSELAGWTHDPDPAATPVQLADHALALVVRGEAWHRFGRLDLARRDLTAAAAIAERPGAGVDPRLLHDLRQYLLAVAAGLGDRGEALAHATAMFHDAQAPAVLLERLHNRDDLRALFIDDDWAALAPLARE